MAVCEPDDPNEIFRRMTEDLDIPVENISEFVVSTLDDVALSSAWGEVKKELYARGEMVEATTETGRDLQSKYHAILLEMKKRRMA